MAVDQRETKAAAKRHRQLSRIDKMASSWSFCSDMSVPSDPVSPNLPVFIRQFKTGGREIESGHVTNECLPAWTVCDRFIQNDAGGEEK